MTPWKPNEAEQQIVSTIGRMALDALAENGVADRATFTKNLKGLARLLDRLPKAHKAIKKPKKTKKPERVGRCDGLNPFDIRHYGENA